MVIEYRPLLTTLSVVTPPSGLNFLISAWLPYSSELKTKILLSESIVIDLGLAYDVPVMPKVDDTPAGVILVTFLLILFAVYILPDESTTIPIGVLPVVPNKLEAPAGVILVTLLPLALAVYTLPVESKAIAYGVELVPPKILETPAGVILVTLLLPLLAVYTLPAESVVIANG